MLTAPRDWRFTAVLRSSLETPDVLGVRGEVSGADYGAARREEVRPEGGRELVLELVAGRSMKIDGAIFYALAYF